MGLDCEEDSILGSSSLCHEYAEKFSQLLVPKLRHQRLDPQPVSMDSVADNYVLCRRGDPFDCLHSVFGLELLRLGPPMLSHERMVQGRSEPFSSLSGYLHSFRYIIDVKRLRVARWVDRKVCDVDPGKHAPCKLFYSNQPSVFESDQGIADNATRGSIQQYSFGSFHTQSFEELRMP